MTRRILLALLASPWLAPAQKLLAPPAETPFWHVSILASYSDGPLFVIPVKIPVKLPVSAPRTLCWIAAAPMVIEGVVAFYASATAPPAFSLLVTTPTLTIPVNPGSTTLQPGDRIHVQLA